MLKLTRKLIPGQFRVIKPGPVPHSKAVPHGAPGRTATGRVTNLPPARQGNTVLEALGGPNKIAMGESTVLIGG